MQQGREAAKKNGRAEAANAVGVETGVARAQLARVLASAAFDASERNRRFLRYVVGLQQPRTRVLLVGLVLLGVLGLGSGIGALWLGSAASPADGTEQVAGLRQGPSILIAPFEDDSGEPGHPALARGFTREVIAGLIRFSELFVFGPETAFRHEAAADDRRAAAELRVEFVLSGGVTTSANRFHVTVSLIDATSGRYLWSGKFDGQLTADQVITVRDKLADQVVLAQSYGILFTHKASEIQGKPPQSFTSYECVLHFYQYWRRYDAELYGSARECLEQAIVDEPDYADAFASLALIYADAYRFRLDQGTISGDPLARALELAHLAVDLAPHSTRAYHALHLVYWLMNDVERSLQAAERGLALNPNDSELLAELGLRYCLRAQWDKGLPLVQQAYARNPAQPGQYRIALFLHHYVSGRYEEALAEARKIDVQSVTDAHITRAMPYAQLGRAEEARAAVGEILAIDPVYGEHVIADLHSRNLHPDLIEVVVDGLIKAGLAVSSGSMPEAS